MQDAFREIYSRHDWGSSSRSGPGSEPRYTEEYRHILQDALGTLEVATVVDLGCGDWSSSRLIDWSGRQYLGIDVVPELIEDLTARFAGPNVRFAEGDLTGADLPGGDLAIVKDVLQHWPNQLVHDFLGRLDRFKFALITNDCRKVYRGGVRRLWRRHEPVGPNVETTVGGSRPLRLLDAPFRFRGARRLAEIEMRIGTTDFTKEVLLWSRATDQEQRVPFHCPTGPG